MDPTRLFVVSGAACSGLERTARVLTDLGAPCGYEEVFSPAAFRAGPTLYWPPRVAGDASWYAAPVLAKLPPRSVVVHQVRDPRVAIPDICASGVIERAGEARDFYEDFVPACHGADAVERAARFWLRWNAMIEAVAAEGEMLYTRLVPEEMSAERVAETTALLGLPRGFGAAQEALDAADAMPRPPASRRMAWSELADAGLERDLRAAAERYGFAA